MQKHAQDAFCSKCYARQICCTITPGMRFVIALRKGKHYTFAMENAYRISCSNEILKTDLKTGRLIWFIITLLGSRHFACDDFVNDATKVNLGCGPIF